MSWKSVTFLFASTAILRLLSLNILHSFFFVISASLSVCFVTASPSSLYSPTFMLRFCSCESR